MPQAARHTWAPRRCSRDPSLLPSLLSGFIGSVGFWPVREEPVGKHAGVAAWLPQTSAHAHRLLCALQATVFFPIEVRHAAQGVGWAVQAGEQQGNLFNLLCRCLAPSMPCRSCTCPNGAAVCMIACGATPPCPAATADVDPRLQAAARPQAVPAHPERHLLPHHAGHRHRLGGEWGGGAAAADAVSASSALPVPERTPCCHANMCCRSSSSSAGRTLRFSKTDGAAAAFGGTLDLVWMRAVHRLSSAAERQQ